LRLPDFDFFTRESIAERSRRCGTKRGEERQESQRDFSLRRPAAFVRTDAEEKAPACCVRT